MPDVQVGGQTVTVDRFSLHKSVRIITLLTELQRQIPELTQEYAAFRRKYADDYAVELTRVQALMQFPSVVIYDAEDNPLLVNGELVTKPSEVGKFTEADWERCGQVVRLPASPDQAETFLHMAPIVFERAQEPALRLLALVAMDSDRVSRYVENGSLYERLDEFAHDVLYDADLAEIMELVAVAAEVIDTTVLAKARTLGKRLRPMRAMVGLRDREPDDDSSSQEKRPPVTPNIITSSGSLVSSDGNPASSDDSPSTSSATSSTSPKTTRDTETTPKVAEVAP